MDLPEKHVADDHLLGILEHSPLPTPPLCVVMVVSRCESVVNSDTPPITHPLRGSDINCYPGP